MYRIDANPDTGLLTIAVKGFWTLNDVHTYMAALREEAGKLLARGKVLTFFYDYTDAAIQSQEVVNAFITIAETGPALARKVAMFTEGKLARRQAQRIAAVRENITVFEDRTAAMAWLAEP